VLTLAYTCSFIDRQILTMLIDPIRRDLHVTDTQVALLGSLAFTVFYTLLGVPIARLADRANRRNIMAAGVALWSLMTAACGLARGFWPLFGARVGVGVGEAALSPAAFSVLSDLFPARRLGRAISAYSTGIYFGAGLALIVGGTVIKKITSASIRELPFIGTILPWQLVFLVVSTLGIPVFLLMLTLREPRRRGRAPTALPDASAWPALRAFLAANARTLAYHFGAFSLYGIAINSYLFWAPTMMMRNFGWSPPRTGFTVGVLLLVFGTAGVYTGGWVADRMAARGYRDAMFRAAMFGMCCGLPCVVATPLAPSDTLVTIGLALSIFFLAFPQGLPSAALQAMTPNPLRAQVTAIYFFVGSLIASGIGPVLAGLLNDYAFHDPLAVRYSLCIVVAIVVPLSLAIVYAGLGAYRASVERAGNA
jgi:MFS family permease